MNDMQLIERADRARAILESPVYTQAWDDTRAAIIMLIETTPLSQTQTAEDLRRCLKLLRDVRSNMELFMKQGKVASFKLEQEKAQEKARRENPLRKIFR